MWLISLLYYILVVWCNVLQPVLTMPLIESVQCPASRAQRSLQDSPMLWRLGVPLS